MTEEELIEAGFADSPDDELDFELEALKKSKRKMKLGMHAVYRDLILPIHSTL